MSKKHILDRRPSTGGWGNEAARHLIQHAARRAPPPLADRLEEEWLADLATRNGQLSRLMLGLGCCWATSIIIRDHLALDVLATRSAAGGSTLPASAHPHLTFPFRRMSAAVVIIGIHLAVIYALATGLGGRFVSRLPPTMNADFLHDTRPRESPPLPRTVNLVQPLKMDFGPRPDIQTDADPREDAINQETPPPVAHAIPLSLPAVVKRVLGGPGKGFPNSDDYYPPAARRLGEQGSTAMQVCVDPNGKLTGEPQITRSSGSPRLDEGAMKLTKAGSGHYRATVENGTPVSSCYGFLIRFSLQ